MKFQFPDSFLWGAASSATQTEGASVKDGKAMNIWDFWYQQEPEKFFEQVGPDNTSMFYERYQEDIANMHNTGLNSFRTSLSWARLIPNGRDINPKAVEFYDNVINRLIENDIEPIINLFHFDMPYHLQKKGDGKAGLLLKLLSIMLNRHLHYSVIVCGIGPLLMNRLFLWKWVT